MKIKKNIAVMQIILLLLSMLLFVSVPNPAFAADELVSNGGFEGSPDFVSWTLHPASGIVISTSDVYAGSKSAHFTDVSDVQYYNASQQFTVDKTKKYLLTFWAKAVAGQPYVLLRQLRQDDTVITSTTIDVTESGWTNYTKTFGPAGSGADIVFNSDTVSFKITLYAAASGSASTGEAYYDEISFTKNFVPNGGFEFDLSSWAYTGASKEKLFAEVSESAKKWGSKGAHLRDTSTTSYTSAIAELQVSPSDNYSFSFWGKKIAGSPYVTIEEEDGTGAVIAHTDIALDSNDWKLYTMTFGPSGADVTFNTETGLINIRLNASADDPLANPKTVINTGEAYFDGVSFFKNSNEKVLNRGFEDSTDFSSWTLHPASGIEISTGDVYAGSKSAHLTDASAIQYYNMSQDFTVDNNSKYSFSFWAKAVTGQPYARIREYRQDQSLCQTTSIYVSGANWTNYTKAIGPIGSGSDIIFHDETVSVKITFDAAASGVESTGEVYYDEISFNVPNISDDGFESDVEFGGWDLTNIAYPGEFLEISTYEKMYGQKSVHLLDTSTAYSNSIHQELKVNPNVKYTLSFYAKNVSGSSVIYLRELDAGRKTNKTTSVNVNNAAWTQYTKSIGPSGSGADVIFDADTETVLIILYAATVSVDSASLSTGEVYYDDVTLVNDIAIPTPTPTPTPAPMPSPTPTVTPIPTSTPTATAIFSDGFESNDFIAGGWSTTNCSIVPAPVYAGSYAARIGSSGTGVLNKSQSTSSYCTIQVEYARRTTGCDATIDEFKTEWYDGSSWNVLEQLTGSALTSANDTWTLKTCDLPIGAINNSSFQIRFTVSFNDSAEYAYIDAVKITGISIPTDPDRGNYLSPPPIIGVTPPAWLANSVVHSHVDSGTRKIALYGLDPVAIVDALAGTGVPAIVSHIKAKAEGQVYPTTVEGAIQNPDLVGRDVISEYLTEAAAESVKFVGYYCTHADDRALELHPEWANRNIDGSLYDVGSKGMNMCLNTGYKDYLKNILVELAEKGIDGLYFDSYRHAPNRGCFCQACRDRFAKEYPGEAFPTSASRTDSQDIKLVQMGDKVVAEAFAEISAALKEVNPNIVTYLAKVTDMPLIDSANTSPDWAESADALKTEFSLSSYKKKEPLSTDISISKPRQPVRLTMNQLLNRDGGHKLTHTWYCSREEDEEYDDLVKTVVSTMVTNGCISNLVPLHIIGSDEIEITPAAEYTNAINYGLSLSPYLEGRKYLTWATVHYPERYSEEISYSLDYNSDAYGDDDPEYVGQTWGEFFWPIFGSVQTLMENHVPMGMITDKQITDEQFVGIKVIIEPHPDQLSNDEKAGLNSFVANGGIVIYLDDDNPNTNDYYAGAEWHRASEQPALFAKLWNDIVSKAGLPPVEVDAPPHTQASFIKTSDGKLVVSLLNDINWMDFRVPHSLTNFPRIFTETPAVFSAKIKVRNGTVSGAKLQPDDTTLSVQTVGSEKWIDISDIDIHNLVVLDGSF